jgi:hypothetical protein
LLACDAAPRPPAKASPIATVRSAQPDSGVWSNAQTHGHWRSIVRAGYVREIHETVALSGAMQGTRVYEYDTAGVLRRVTEQTWRAERDTIIGDTLPRTPAPRRQSVVEFQADGPVLASRTFRDQPERMSRVEMRALYARGYALLNKARQ